MSKLPANIQTIYDNLSGFQKTYCEYRSRGLSQAVSAEKAGSQAESKGSLATVGFGVEAIPGVRDYIDYLKSERAKTLPIDEAEIIQKLRDNYTKASEDGDYKAANQAIELLGKVLGLFSQGKTGPKTKQEIDAQANPFKDEGIDEGASKERVAKLVSMMKDLGKDT